MHIASEEHVECCEHTFDSLKKWQKALMREAEQITDLQK